MKLKMKINRNNIGEFIRFGIVGVVSVCVLYLCYYLLLFFINHSIAYTIGYIISLVVNYYLTLVFTFKEKTSYKKTAGFLLSHVINYCLQIILLNVFIYWGIDSRYALIPVLMICVPTNFIFVRFFIKKK